jgi:hypothetical protein
MPVNGTSPRRPPVDFRQLVEQFRDSRPERRKELEPLLVDAAKHELDERGIGWTEVKGGLRLLGRRDGTALERVIDRAGEVLGTTYEYLPGKLAEAGAMYQPGHQRVVLSHRAIRQPKLDQATLHETHHAYVHARTRRGDPPRFAGRLAATGDEPMCEGAAPLYAQHMSLDELSAYCKGLARRRKKLARPRPKGEAVAVFAGIAATARQLAHQAVSVTQRALAAASANPDVLGFFQDTQGMVWYRLQTPPSALLIPLRDAELLAAYRQRWNKEPEAEWLDVVRTRKGLQRKRKTLVSAALSNLGRLVEDAQTCAAAFPPPEKSRDAAALHRASVALSRAISEAEARHRHIIG